MSTTADTNAGTATEASADTALTAREPLGRDRRGDARLPPFRQQRDRRAAAAVPAALPRQPRQLGPGARRPPCGRPRGHPARQPRRRRLDRRRSRQRRGHGPRRPALHRRARASRQVDLLGFSLGGYVAQEVALVRPRLVRRIVLAGTAPRGAPRIHRWSDDVYALATPDVLDPNRFLRLFFSGSEESRAKGMEYLGRITARTVDRDEPTDLATRDAQLEAIARWGIPDPSKLVRLAGDHPAGVRRQRRQRHDDDHREQPPPRPAPAQLAAAHLSRTPATDSSTSTPSCSATTSSAFLNGG